METLSKPSDFFTHSRAEMYMKEGNFTAAMVALDRALVDVRAKEAALLEMFARAKRGAKTGSAK